MYNRWRKKEKKTHWEYETVILVNTDHAFYYVGEFAHSMEKIVDQTDHGSGDNPYYKPGK